MLKLLFVIIVLWYCQCSLMLKIYHIIKLDADNTAPFFYSTLVSHPPFAWILYCKQMGLFVTFIILNLVVAFENTNVGLYIFSSSSDIKVLYIKVANISTTKKKIFICLLRVILSSWHFLAKKKKPKEIQYCSPLNLIVFSWVLTELILIPWVTQC